MKQETNNNEEEQEGKVEFSGVPPKGDESPLTELIHPKPLVDMTDEELIALIAKTRQTMESPQTLRKSFSTKSASSKAKKPKVDVKYSATDLLSKLGISV